MTHAWIEYRAPSAPRRRISGSLVSGLLWLQFLGLPGSLIGSEPAVDQPIDFAAQIRPLLSDRCFTCHGPDSAQRATDLRLDDEDSVHQWAVVAGDAEASELIRRIESDDPDQVMPPPGSNLSLSPQERQLLRRWWQRARSRDTGPL